MRGHATLQTISSARRPPTSTVDGDQKLMGHLRERYNAKGRQSSSGRAKKRVKHGASTTESTYEQAESNEPIVLEVKSQEQKELDRRERLRLEVH